MTENNASESLELPLGFQTTGVACGVKGDSGVLDLSLFVSDRPAAAAGVFTQSKVCGAPVKVSRQRVPSESARAVVINSGNANACTGERGLEDAQQMTQLVASEVGCNADEVLVCSTGLIGHFLPMDAISSGIPAAHKQLSSSPEAYANAAKGMMTTDTFHKQVVRELELSGAPVRISGAAKGAAMIGPNMATMLAVIMTDASLTSADADQALRDAVNQSFNCISVEGHTSTSDTVLLLANGASGTEVLSGDDLAAFRYGVEEVAVDLAKAIIQDAEGADHFITVDVLGLRTREEAYAIAKTISDDALVKTAITGADPNWGRIVSCCGRTGVDLLETDITLQINGTTIYERGTPVEYDETVLSNQMRDNRDVSIALSFPFGDAQVRFWTSDLTKEYVRLNSEYTT
ncbi:MAG: bifunctional ornithine acetyltransferase/N-acetylglutamate synthase [Planctomycetaceae bacterium]|nr:bifunctional ornithine acetyltransferase/N-acetylglutamate synthase [Planctomycetaceae bacterium]